MSSTERTYEVYTTGNACDEPEHYPVNNRDPDNAPPLPTKSIEDIDPRTVEMIESGLENLKKGNVSDPIDMEEDFPDLFDDD